MKTEKFYDMLIYELSTGKIESIVGERMSYNTGFYNAVKREQTACMRINDHFDTKIVETGKYKVGDILKKEKLK